LAPADIDLSPRFGDNPPGGAPRKMPR